MFDIGWTELLLIGIVALIVVGPKDLPMMFRQLGRFTGKMRGMAREFQRAMDQAADETGVKDVARDLRETASARNLGLDTLKDAATKFESWDPRRNATRPSTATGSKPPGAAPAGPAAPPAADAAGDPGAAAPAPERGPHTQALAEAQASLRAEREAAARPAAEAAPARTTPGEGADKT
jgi:sec-independent protein translocase protein TatB